MIEEQRLFTNSQLAAIDCDEKEENGLQALSLTEGRLRLDTHPDGNCANLDFDLVRPTN
jgi:hypothetical protein